MNATPLPDVHHEERFGGKAVQLGAALRAGLPVPPGAALSVDFVDAVARGESGARARCAAALALVGGARVAVRSSAVGEDSASASFAGQHLTRLNVDGAGSLVDSVLAIWRSGRSESALAYRARLGIAGEPRVAAVVQRMVEADCAGVLFTRNPVDGTDERIVEAAWGLGEAVVAGLVEPDRWRLARGGAVTEEVVGDKDVAVRLSPSGGTDEVAVPASERRVPCLSRAQLGALEALAARCEAAWPGAHDIEWAFAAGTLYLLQRRAVTR